MTTVSPEKVIEASAYTKDALTASKRLALATLAAKWRRVDPSDVRGSIEPLLPEITELMHEQQALGRQIAWTQGELAAAVATGQEPGTVTLPLEAARDGRLRNGPPFAQALSRAIPGALARIKSGIQPAAAVADAGRIVALQVGSIAHDEARLVTQDLVLNQGGGAVPRLGYARKPEGSHTCDFCRTLATRGPVYSADTAGFRAHRFCDCTTYAVPMESFEVDPDDWSAYQRWAARKARKAVKSTATNNDVFQHLDRLDQIQAQIESYQPIVDAGNGTEWMRTKLKALVNERDQLRDAGALAHLKAQEVPTSVIAGPDWRSQPGLDDLLGEFAYDPQKRAAWAEQHFLFFDDRTGVGLSLSRVSMPSVEEIEQLQYELNRAINIAKADFGFWRNPDISMFDVSDTMPPWVMGSTNASSNRALLNRKFWDLLDPEKAAVEQSKQVMGRRWSISMLVDPEDSVHAHILHELGHQVDQPFFDQEFLERSRKLYDKWRYTGQPLGIANKQITMLDFDDIPAFTDVDIEILKSAVTAGPTLYARSNQDEMFAEAYATWKLRDKIDLDPEMRNWIEDYAQEFGWS